MAWMNAETLALTLAEGRTVFWSPQRQEVLARRHVGRGATRPAGRLRRRRRHAAVPGRPAGRRRLPHRQPVVLLPVLRRGRYCCGRRDLGRAGDADDPRLGLDEFRTLALHPHGHPAGPAARRPDHPVVRPEEPAGGRRTGLPAEAVEHGEDLLELLVVVAATPGDAAPPGASTCRSWVWSANGAVDRGILAALEGAAHCLARTGPSRPPAAQRPASSATWWGTWSARSSTRPMFRRTPGPRRRGGVVIEPPRLYLTGGNGWRRPRTSSPCRGGEPTDELVRAVRGRCNAPTQARRRRCPAARRAAGRCPRATTSRRCPPDHGSDLYAGAVELLRHLPAGDIFQVVLAGVVRLLPDAQPVDLYRVPAGEPEPGTGRRAPAGPDAGRAFP